MNKFKTLRNFLQIKKKFILILIYKKKMSITKKKFFFFLTFTFHVYIFH